MKNERTCKQVVASLNAGGGCTAQAQAWCFTFYDRGDARWANDCLPSLADCDARRAQLSTRLLVSDVSACLTWD